MGIPLWEICCFSLAAFNIYSLCLILINLINMCLGVFPLGFILSGTLWVSLTWVAISFPILGSFQLLSPWVFYHGLSFCFLLLRLLWFKCCGISHCPRGPWGCPHFFWFFFLFSSLLHLFPPFYLLAHLSYLLSRYFTVGCLQSVFDLIYCIIHF